MAGLTPGAPKIGGATIPRPKSVPGAGVRVQRSVRAPTNFPHVSPARRDYAKAAAGAENPLGVSEGQSNFGQTGLTGET